MYWIPPTIAAVSTATLDCKEQTNTFEISHEHREQTAVRIMNI